MSDKKDFDLIVIGSGPGGYVAAIKGAQKGAKVALVEKEALGGTCLNVGCIPTKTLIAGAQTLHMIKKAQEFGIETGPVRIAYDKMKQRKDAVVKKIRTGLEGLIKSNQIEIFKGHGQLQNSQEVKVQGEHSVLLRGKSIIIATGSEPLNIPAFPCDHQKVFNSTSILELTTLPKKMAIIGGGYIGCEFASLFNELGVEVVILEALPSIVALQGKTVADTLSKAFTTKGIQVRTNVFVEGIDHPKEGLSIRLKGGETLACDIALVSVGRKICTEGLGLANIGLGLNSKGAIPVDEKMQTSVPGIYAIGDVTGLYMLAHVASHQGIVAADNATGGQARMHYESVPAVIFTQPEIAMVGLTEEEATSKGYEISIGKFPFSALGKATAAGESEGFAQIIADKKTGQILGALAIGHEASALVGEMGLAISNELTLESIIDTIHAHPTLPEAWLEAALMTNGTPIHFPPRKK